MAPAGSTECSRQRSRGEGEEGGSESVNMRVSCGDPLEDHKNAKCSHHAMWQLPVPVQRRVDGAGADGDCLEVGGSTRDGDGDCCCCCDWGDIGR